MELLSARPLMQASMALWCQICQQMDCWLLRRLALAIYLLWRCLELCVRYVRLPAGCMFAPQRSFADPVSRLTIDVHYIAQIVRCH